MDKFPDDLGDIMTLPQLRKHITEIIMDEKKKHPEGGYAEFVLPSDHNGTAMMRELGQIFNIFEYKDEAGVWKPVWIIVPKYCTVFRVMFAKKT